MSDDMTIYTPFVGYLSAAQCMALPEAPRKYGPLGSPETLIRHEGGVRVFAGNDTWAIGTVDGELMRIWGR